VGLHKSLPLLEPGLGVSDLPNEIHLYAQEKRRWIRRNKWWSELQDEALGEVVFAVSLVAYQGALGQAARFYI
jgi:hypothetical protein